MNKYHLFIEAKCKEPMKVKDSDKEMIGYYQNFYATFQVNEEAVEAIRKIIEANNAELIKIEVNDFKGDIKDIKCVIASPDMAGVWGRTGRVYF